MPSPRALLVVRHGQSTWNADGRWQGQADPPLSALGEQQAAAAGRTLHGCDAVFSSDLERAVRTAEIIATSVLADGRTGVVCDPRLRERDAGEWTGLTRREIEARDPGALRDGRRPPGFEPDDRLAARALAALAECAATLPGGATALVVTHGGVIRSVERALGGPGEVVPNLGGRRLLAEAGGLVLGETVLLLDAATEVTIPRQL
ncbi:MAG TPA: histidine phosphatase family protein [Acidimicrobiia bacterium]|nr:histidine phosphatase family protein [Acidimicrobiia bacterium]